VLGGASGGSVALALDAAGCDKFGARRRFELAAQLGAEPGCGGFTKVLVLRPRFSVANRLFCAIGLSQAGHEQASLPIAAVRGVNSLSVASSAVAVTPADTAAAAAAASGMALLPQGVSAGVHLADGAGARALRLRDPRARDPEAVEGRKGKGPLYGMDWWGPPLPLEEGDYTAYLPIADPSHAPPGARLVRTQVGPGASLGRGVTRLERVVVVEATSEGAALTLLVREPSAGETDMPYWLHNRSSVRVLAAQAPCASLPEPSRFTPCEPGEIVPLLAETHVTGPTELSFQVATELSRAIVTIPAAEEGVRTGERVLDAGPGLRLLVWLEARGPVRAMCVRDAPAARRGLAGGVADVSGGGSVVAVDASVPVMPEPVSSGPPLARVDMSVSLVAIGLSLIARGREHVYVVAEGISFSSRGEEHRRENKLSVGWVEASNQLPSAPFAAFAKPSAAKVGSGASARVASAAPRGHGATPRPPSAAMELCILNAASPTETAAVLQSVSARLANLELAVDTRTAAALVGAYADVSGALDELLEMAASADATASTRAAERARVKARGGLSGGLAERDGGEAVRSAEDVLAAELASAAPGGVRAVHRTFVRWLNLQPCKLHLSARSSGSGMAALVEAVERLGADGAAPGRVSRSQRRGAVVSDLVRNSLSSALLNFSRAPLRVAELRVEEFWGPTAQLHAAVSEHYARCATRQLQGLLGSVEFLGNPRNLFGHLAHGVYDAFYEPFDGLITGPAEFIAGLNKGLFSFTTNIITGVTQSAASVTGSLARGVAELSADRAYVDKRSDVASQRGAVKDAGEGVVKGLKGVGQGLFRGVQGLVMDPIRGARRGGAEGLARGVATGVLGLVVKPVVGVVDLATGVAEGVAASSATAEDQRALAALTMRSRLPRAFGIYGEVVPYDASSARFAAVLESIRSDSHSGRFEADRLVGHVVDVLVTTRHVIGIDVHTALAAKRRRWYVPLEQIAFTEVRDRSVLIHLTTGSAPRDVLCVGPEVAHLHELITQAHALQNRVD